MPSIFSQLTTPISVGNSDLVIFIKKTKKLTSGKKCLLQLRHFKKTQKLYNFSYVCLRGKNNFALNSGRTNDKGDAFQCSP